MKNYPDINLISHNEQKVVRLKLAESWRTRLSEGFIN